VFEQETRGRKRKKQKKEGEPTGIDSGVVIPSPTAAATTGQSPGITVRREKIGTEEEKCGLGFREWPVAGFLIVRNARRAIRWHSTARADRTGSRPRRVRHFPAQAQVVAWAWVCATRAYGVGLLGRRAGRRGLRRAPSGLGRELHSARVREGTGPIWRIGPQAGFAQLGCRLVQRSWAAGCSQLGRRRMMFSVFCFRIMFCQIEF
jgi:hypothetical protein